MAFALYSFNNNTMYLCQKINSLSGMAYFLNAGHFQGAFKRVSIQFSVRSSFVITGRWSELRDSGMTIADAGIHALGGPEIM